MPDTNEETRCPHCRVTINMAAWNAQMRAEGERAATERIARQVTRIGQLPHLWPISDAIYESIMLDTATAIERGEHLESATIGTVER